MDMLTPSPPTHHAAVHVEPPVADEVLLVEQGAIGTEEGEFGKSSITVAGTDVEGLALGLRITIVASVYLTVTDKSSLRNLSINRVVLPRGAGDGLL